MPAEHIRDDVTLEEQAAEAARERYECEQAHREALDAHYRQIDERRLAEQMERDAQPVQVFTRRALSREEAAQAIAIHNAKASAMVLGALFGGAK